MSSLASSIRRAVPRPPTRLVIWSWPSDRVVHCVRPDARIKACRTNVEGYFLASFLDLISPQTPIGLAGYSYGARVVTGGLHILGGGVLEGRQLAQRHRNDAEPANAILLGAAMANDWLLPGRRHERAISQVDRLVVLVNERDRVLHWYPHLWGRGGPVALGAEGVAAPGRLGPERAKLVQINVEPELHRRHGWKYFSSSPTVMSLVRRELLLVPASKVETQ